MAIQRIYHDVDTFDIAAAPTVESLKIIHSITTYENMSSGAVVHINESGYVGLAATNISSRMPAIGVLEDAAASGALATVVRTGPAHSAQWNFSGFVGRGGYVSKSGAIDVSQVATSGQIQVLGPIQDGSGLIVSVGAMQSV